jgi:3-hydroxyisobutyrate dehydrogenase
MKIGIAGTGRMGTAIGQRLLSTGHDLVVWNRTLEKTEELVSKGARAVGSPRELASSADVVITILTDAKAIEDVYRGADGLLSGDVAGKLFIEMSTVRPETEERLAEAVRSKAAAMVECPVGGTTGPAREGKLFGLVGGETADVERAMPVLQDLCRRIEHLGPVGAGASAKLAINLPLVVFWQAFGEALALLRHLDIAPERVADIFADTSGGPNVLKSRAAAVASALKGETVPGTFDIDSMRKDMRTMLEEASAMGIDLPVTGRALECYDESARAGLGKCDGANEAVYWSRRPG